MTERKVYTTAGAFRRALEERQERLKNTSRTDQTDINRLRRQVSFDRLLARLFHNHSVPRVLKGGYALELRFKAARSTVDIDLTIENVSSDAVQGKEIDQVVREMLEPNILSMFERVSVFYRDVISDTWSTIDFYCSPQPGQHVHQRTRWTETVCG